jgi:hypothetical protein
MVSVCPAWTIRHSIGVAAPSLFLLLVARLLLDSLANLHDLAGDAWHAGFQFSLCDHKQWGISRPGNTPLRELD